MTILRPVPAAARVGFGIHRSWDVALAQATADLAGPTPDVIILVCGSAFVDEMPAIAHEVWRAFHAPFVFGATGRGVIAQGAEYEDGATVAVMALCLPGAVLSPVHLSQRSLTGMTDAASCHQRLNVIPGDVNGWLMLANPFRFDAQFALETLATAYPDARLVGGLASPDAGTRRTALLINGEAIFDGAIALGIGGPYDILPMVAHGCEPIGQTWTITGVAGDWIESIGGRPPIEVIDEMLRSTSRELRERTRRNLLVGLAVDEYRTEFERGDFLVRSIVGVDQQSGAIAVGARARTGQTIQFQLRDAFTADQDLERSLERLRLRGINATPVALLAFAGHERGQRLFASASHDARAIQRVLHGIATVGLYTASEIGPAGRSIALHSMSLTAGLIVRRPEPDQAQHVSA